jgi:hypothetical protein
MYVKWVIRRHKNEELANINFFDAYLVQSYKNSMGEPRQRTIAYLGNLRQIDGQFPVIERALFYLRMEEYLARTVPRHLITEEERAKLYTGLAEVAPAPSEEEIQQGTVIHANWTANYWQAKALKPSDASAGFADYELDDDEGEQMQLEVPLDHFKVLGRLNSGYRKSSGDA